MATFPSIKPTYGQQKRSAPNTRTISFADGYEHRILFGLAEHQNPKIYNFTFNVSEMFPLFKSLRIFKYSGDKTFSEIQQSLRELMDKLGPVYQEQVPVSASDQTWATQFDA